MKRISIFFFFFSKVIFDLQDPSKALKCDSRVISSLTHHLGFFFLLSSIKMEPIAVNVIIKQLKVIIY